MPSEFPFLDLDEVRRLAERPEPAGTRFALLLASEPPPARCLAALPGWCPNPPIGTIPAGTYAFLKIPICHDHAVEWRDRIDALLLAAVVR